MKEVERSRPDFTTREFLGEYTALFHFYVILEKTPLNEGKYKADIEIRKIHLKFQ